MLRSNSKSMGNHVVSPEEEKERLRWEGFAEKGFKSGMKERVGYHTFLFFFFTPKILRGIALQSRPGLISGASCIDELLCKIVESEVIISFEWHRTNEKTQHSRPIALVKPLRCSLKCFAIFVVSFFSFFSFVTCFSVSHDGRTKVAVVCLNSITSVCRGFVVSCTTNFTLNRSNVHCVPKNVHLLKMTFFGFHKVKWLQLTGDVNMCKIFSSNFPRI